MVPKYKTTQAVFQRSVKPKGYSAVRVGKSLKNKSAKQGRLTTPLIRLPGLILTSVAQSRALTSHGRGCWFDPSITTLKISRFAGKTWNRYKGPELLSTPCAATV